MLGVNHSKLVFLKKEFPTLKLIARGDTIKAIGVEQEIDRFAMAFEDIMRFIERYNRLSNDDLITLISSDSKGKSHGAGDVLVFGNKGMQIRPKSDGQKRMVQAARDNDMVIAAGPAGTGKTYVAVAMAVRALKEKEVKRIVLTRPAVEAGESLGFLPGDMQEKLDPYMQPIYDALYDMIPAKRLEEYMESRVIEIAPLAYMRGRTLDHAFVILDEAQNCTENQMKMFLTRMGMHAKFVITGDHTQVDLPHKKGSGLNMAMRRLAEVKGIGIVKLDSKDVIRHRLVKQIIDAFEN